MMSQLFHRYSSKEVNVSSEQQEREAFEAHTRTLAHPDDINELLKKKWNEHYFDKKIEAAWQGWLARSRVHTKEQPVGCGDGDTYIASDYHVGYAQGYAAGKREAALTATQPLKLPEDEAVEVMLQAANATPCRRIVTEKTQHEDGTITQEKVEFVPNERDRMLSAYRALLAHIEGRKA